MIVYLASPDNQLQADAAIGMPVLLSYALAGAKPFLLNGYQESFGRILIDSGAFSELSSGKVVPLERYAEWSQQWFPHADAIAGLDDIRGDWRRSLENYKSLPWGFPTFHDTDPPELLSDLIAIAREATKGWPVPKKPWIGLGILPPRHGKERWVRDACERIPDDFHIHGWALREYTHVRRLDSVDSTNWWRDAMKLRTQLSWLTYGECLEIIVKRYIRWQRRIVDEDKSQQSLMEIAS